jgi:hypothetical protein
MAAEWIPMRLDLAKDPAVIGMALALGLEEDTVVGKLHRLWSWSNEQLIDGRAKGVTLGWVNLYVRCPNFAEKMAEFSWLKVGEDGYVSFPKFDRWNSTGAKIRLKARERQKKKRHASVTEMSQKKCDKSVTHKKEKEKENKEEKNTSADAVVAAQKPPKPRDEIFDAVAALSGLDPATAGGQIGKTSAVLKKATPPYTASDIQEFGRRFHELCPYAARNGSVRPTVGEIEKYIGLLRAPPAPVQPPVKAGLFATKGEQQLDFAARMALDAIPRSPQ